MSRSRAGRTPFRLGIETLLEQRSSSVVYEAPRDHSPTASAPQPTTYDILELGDRAAGKRIALIAHPASVDADLTPSVESVLPWASKVGARLSALFGPQHGLRGEKQDDMIESVHYTDPGTGLPVFSLYGETRRLTEQMAESFDILLFDLQDVGVRVYTFLTTLFYVLEDLERWPEKELWVLDRPNPTGRAVEGLRLEPGWESFVGAAPIPMQHGLTSGEMALWFHATRKLRSRLTVVPMSGWAPQDPRSAWPSERVWVQPSPNMPGLYTARVYPGTVMVEGTTLSEGRGTTRPLSMIGDPRVDWAGVLDSLRREIPPSGVADPSVIDGCRLRRVAFEPTFHKHAGVLTPGIDLVAEGRFYDPALFRPYRFVAALFKMIRRLHPDIDLWKEPPYEYEYERMPVDVITGGSRLREWVDDPNTSWGEFDDVISSEEKAWRVESEPFRLYQNHTIP